MGSIFVPDLIKQLSDDFGPILIDSIGGFIMESIEIEEKEWIKKLNLLIDILKSRKYLTIIVGEQVGLEVGAFDV